MTEGGGGGKDSNPKKAGNRVEVVEEGDGPEQRWRKEKRRGLGKERSKVRDPTTGQSGQTEEGHTDEKERINQRRVLLVEKPGGLELPWYVMCQAEGSSDGIGNSRRVKL